MPRGKYSDWLSDYSDWLVSPPNGITAEAADDLWCGVCNCIVKRKKYNAEIHMKTVKHLKAMGVIENEAKKHTSGAAFATIGDNSDEYVVLNTEGDGTMYEFVYGNGEMNPKSHRIINNGELEEDPFYDTISTVEDSVEAQTTTLHFPTQHSQQSTHITYLSAPEIKKEKKGVTTIKSQYVNWTPTPVKRFSKSKPFKEEDDYFVFGKHVANELRAVEDIYVLQTMKMKINTILFEGRTGQYSRDCGDDSTSETNEGMTAADAASVTGAVMSLKQDETSGNLTAYEVVSCPSMPSIS